MNEISIKNAFRELISYNFLQYIYLFVLFSSKCEFSLDLNIRTNRFKCTECLRCKNYTNFITDQNFHTNQQMSKEFTCTNCACIAINRFTARSKEESQTKNSIFIATI